LCKRLKQKIQALPEHGNRYEMERIECKKGAMLFHTKARIKFEYIGEIKPQFTNQTFVELLNLKTGKTETFQKNTYLQYFELLRI
jgi:hypothetical protein